jgi:serine/threonine-protein kinase RsbW
MAVTETLSVPGTIPGVRQAVAAFEGFSGRHAVAEADVWRVSVAIDEILSNIVRHGGAPASPIAVTFSIDDRRTIGVEVVDGATPFNPLLAPPPDRTGGLDRRAPGGLGIALVRMLMDETAYERRADRNHFVMRCRPHADR